MLLILLLTGWAAICLVQLLHFAAAVRYLGAAPRPVAGSALPLTVLIPVLSEQDVIDESLDWFGALTEALPWLSVVYITSEREPRCPGRPSTQEMLLRRLGSLRGVSAMHYPYREGIMAHQLNYAVQRLAPPTDDDLLLAVYNVDSKPGPEALAHARAELLRDPRTVVQQYAIYPFPAPTNVESSILSHIACWQTRWSLHFEMGRTLASEALSLGGAGGRLAVMLVRPMLYTIGHGLFLRAGCWRELSGFPEDEMNEDAFLGLQLRLAGYGMRTIPYLETALPPPSIRTYLRQQAVWFNGPARAWHYLAKLILGSSGRHASRTKVAWPLLPYAVLETCKLWLCALYWLFGPMLILCVIPAMALRQERYVAFAVWLGLMLWHCWGFHLAVHRVYRIAGVATGAPGGPLAAVAAYALHGVGPLIWLAMSVTGRNRQSNKYKTERVKSSARQPI